MKLMLQTGISGSVVLPVVTANRQFHTINKVAAQVNEKYAPVREAWFNRVDRGEEPENILENKWLFSFGGIHPDAAGDRGSTDDNISAGAVEVTDYREQLRIIRDLGLKGIKLHPDYHDTFINDIRYMRIMDAAAEMGLWVVTHSGWDPMSPDLLHCSPKLLTGVLDKIPGDRLILAHMGSWRCLDEVEELIAGRNVWFDTSMNMSTTVNNVYGGDVEYVSGVRESSGRDRFLRILRKHGSSRLLWGSDCPWEDPMHTVKTWESLDIPPEDNEVICYKNAMKLLREE